MHICIREVDESISANYDATRANRNTVALCSDFSKNHHTTKPLDKMTENQNPFQYKTCCLWTGVGVAVSGFYAVIRRARRDVSRFTEVQRGAIKGREPEKDSRIWLLG